MVYFEEDGGEVRRVWRRAEGGRYKDGRSKLRHYEDFRSRALQAISAALGWV